MKASKRLKNEAVVIPHRKSQILLKIYLPPLLTGTAASRRQDVERNGPREATRAEG